MMIKLACHGTEKPKYFMNFNCEKQEFTTDKPTELISRCRVKLPGRKTWQNASVWKFGRCTRDDVQYLRVRTAKGYEYYKQRYTAEEFKLLAGFAGI